MESVSGPADQPAAFNEMPDRPIGSTRLLQQNRHLADITGLSNVRFAPILLQKSGTTDWAVGHFIKRRPADPPALTRSPRNSYAT